VNEPRGVVASIRVPLAEVAAIVPASIAG